MDVKLPDLDNLLFCKQFILGPRAITIFPNWVTAKVGTGFYLTTHPWLKVQIQRRNNAELVCLGDMLDPFRPEDDNEKVVSRIIDNLHKFENFETDSSNLGGRWLALVTIGNETRLYPDDLGTMTSFYHEDKDGSLWIGSQPQIIAEALDLDRDNAVFECNIKKKITGYPGSLIPYKGISPLFANHFLNLQTFQSIRFWPTKKVEPLVLDSAADTILKLLSGIIMAASNRYKLLITLTGGYDSRATLSACRVIKKEFKYITLDFPGIARSDLTIPKLFADKLNLDYDVLPFVRPEKKFLSMLYRNTSYMVFNPEVLQQARSYLKFNREELKVTSHGAEIGRRTVFYPYGYHPSSTNVKFLCDISNLRTAEAKKVFSGWLEETPRDKDIDIIDLFYWELRVGTYAAMKFTGNDLTYHVMTPFSCRILSEKMLGIAPEFRVYPYTLFRKLATINLPEFTKVPYKSRTFFERAKDLISGVLFDSRRYFNKAASKMVWFVKNLMKR